MDEGKVDNGANERNITQIELNAAGCLVFVSLPSHILSTVLVSSSPCISSRTHCALLQNLQLRTNTAPDSASRMLMLRSKCQHAREILAYTWVPHPLVEAHRFFCALIWWCVDLFCKPQIVQCCCCWGGECKIGTRGFLKIRFTIKAASAQTVNKTSK